MALAMAFTAAKRELGLKNQKRLQTVFPRNQPLPQGTGIASPVTCCPAGTLLKRWCRIAVNKSPGLVESCQLGLLRAWEWSQSSALQLPFVLPLRRGGREKSPFRLEVLRYLYTPECFGCSPANPHLNARGWDVLKILWLMWKLLELCKGSGMEAASACSGVYKVSKCFCKAFLQCEARALLALSAQALSRLLGL